MILKRIPVGSYMANCYIFGDKKTKEVIIIDPGDEQHKIFDVIENGGYIVKGITFTHSHFDHVSALEAVKERYNVPVIRDGETFKVGDIILEIIETPGHSLDGLSFYGKGVVFTGDTLFHMSIGRTDLPTGNLEQLEASVRRLYTLPDNTTVYPGHGIRTTIGYEKKNNPYVRE